MLKIQTTLALCVQKDISLGRKENAFIVQEKLSPAVATAYVRLRTKLGVPRKQQYVIVMDPGPEKTALNVYYAMAMVNAAIHRVVNRAIATHYGPVSIVRDVSIITTRQRDCAKLAVRIVRRQQMVFVQTVRAK